MTPLVSIIIPCYNAAPWLAETLESCFRQTHANLEIILVDNGSADKSLEVAKSFRDPRLIVTSCARKGASAARNMGLSLAKGDFIQFLDADDLLAPDKIEIQLKRIADAPPNSVASGAWTRFRKTPEDGCFKPEPVWRDFQPDEFLITSWLGGGMMPIFAWLAPTKTIRAGKPWNEKLSVNDDGEFFARVVLASAGIAFCPEAKGYYRSGLPISLSSRVDRVAIESEFEAVRLCCEHLLSVNSSSEARRACATAYQRFVYRHYPHYSALTRRAEQQVRKFGGSDLAFSVGHLGAALKSVLGWKATKRLQLLNHRLKRETSHLF